MKNVKLMIIAAMTSIIALSSCTMEKQHYSAGYNVQWNSKAQASKLKQAENKTDEITSQKLVTEEKSDVSNVSNFSEASIKTESSSSISESESASINNESIAILPQNRIVLNSNVKKSTLTNEQLTSGVKTKINKKNNTTQPKSTNETKGGGDRSWLVALLLCFFLGGLGLHRFYLGYNGLGLLMLFTGGFFGVLWLIDFFRILIHSLKPKNGDYN
jgi:thiol:disulfide interchange protein